MANNASKKNSLILWVIIFLTVITLANIFGGPNPTENTQKITYSSLTDMVKKGDVLTVEMKGQSLSGLLKGDKKFTSYAPNDSGLVALLQEHNVPFSAVAPEKEGEASEG